MSNKKVSRPRPRSRTRDAVLLLAFAAFLVLFVAVRPSDLVGLLPANGVELDLPGLKLRLGPVR